jgi:UDP-N-acetylmuramate dehydrogenase
MSPKIDVQENISLAPLTTFKIGGEARFFVRAVSQGEVVEAFKFALEKSLPIFILGGGSNILVSDSGFAGLVIQISIKGIERNGEVITAGGGEEWDGLVSYCVENDLAGVECLSGIPGFTGATPIQNVGAYGQEVAETIESVRVLDRAAMEMVTLSNAQCGFAYRSSIFNSTQKDRYVVLAVTYRLTPHGAPAIRYADIKKYFEERDETPTLGAVREAVIAIRAKKSMVISASDPNSKSAGSFFKNPVVSQERYLEIKNIMAADVPSFPAGAESVKVPAAWLIENSGFHKGYVLGKVGLSANHTLALINRGGAKAADIIALRDTIRDAVQAKFGVVLQPEPVPVGFNER